ncbi:MAG: polyprenyl synthetase family protein [Bacteroidales bacterium]|nr:polyprenyl synthetase family protein [Bacteroidales bacterium]
MPSLKEIKQPVAAEIKAFQKVFREAVRSKVPLLDVIMRYILKAKGKQMRPLFVIYSAALFDNINPSTYRAATLVELMHTATLVHDDVVDDSDQRRGRFSVNYLWKNKIAVLAGDYLLSRGMLLALENKDFEVLEIVSRAVKDMSEGELLQLEKARKLNIDEEVYYEIIRKKTASLLASCFATGATSAGVGKTEAEKMRLIGEYAGMAFQIKDDLFDFQKTNETGKPSGIDIKEKKMTLPLIYLLNQSTSSKRRKLINIIKNHNTDTEKVAWLMEQVNQSGGMAYTKSKMLEFKNKALDLLNEFPEKQARTALEQLIEYTIERRK